jgi:hypothetical protein
MPKEVRDVNYGAIVSADLTINLTHPCRNSVPPWLSPSRSSRKVRDHYLHLSPNGVLIGVIEHSGKTSLIHSIAGEFGLDIYVVSLSAKGMSDEKLTKLMGRVPSRSTKPRTFHS